MNSLILTLALVDPKKGPFLRSTAVPCYAFIVLYRINLKYFQFHEPAMQGRRALEGAQCLS